MYFKQIVLWFLAASAICACTRTDSEHYPVSNKLNKTVILDDFEGKNGKVKWDGTILISNQYPSHGKKCCKITSERNQPYGSSQSIFQATGKLLNISDSMFTIRPTGSSSAPFRSSMSMVPMNRLNFMDRATTVKNFS